MPHRYRDRQCVAHPGRPGAWLAADMFRYFGGITMV